MKILLTGATGFMGNHLLNALHAAGHEVIACVRNVEKFTAHNPHIKAIACDFSQDQHPEHWLPRLTGIDVVINAVGIIQQHGDQSFHNLHYATPVALFEACAMSGINKVIQISALGADANAQSHYHQTKYQADLRLQQLVSDWIIFKPSIVYGSGGKSMALFKAIAAMPVIPLVSKGNQRIQPIHIDDLVQTVLQAVQPGFQGNKIYSLVGSSALSLRELFTCLHNWLGLGRARFIPFPLWLCKIGAKIADYIPGAIFNTGTLQMLQQGNVDDVTPVEKDFGFTPRSILEHYSKTDCDENEYRTARLYFMPLLFRLSLAIVWIMTGLVTLFFFPLSQSYALLEPMGLSHSMTNLALYSGAIIDLSLGIAMLVNYRLKLVASLQILIVLGYTAIITVYLPHFWSHPFGPISKNIPLLAATLYLIMLERRN